MFNKERLDIMFKTPEFTPVEGPTKKTEWTPSKKSTRLIKEAIPLKDEISLKDMALKTGYSAPLVLKVARSLVAGGELTSRKVSANTPTYFKRV